MHIDILFFLSDHKSVHSSQFRVTDQTANEILPGSLLCILTGHGGQSLGWPRPLAPRWSEPSSPELQLDQKCVHQKIIQWQSRV